MLKIATYNVLADAYVKPGYFPDTPPEQLDPARRRPALLKRLAGLGADLLCLQEAEAPLFAVAQSHLLAHSAHYLSKGSGKPDGCATFVHGARVVEERPLYYSDGSGHVALTLIVEFDGRRLALSNTHLKWDRPDREIDTHLGCVQLSELIARRQALTSGTEGWVICGDFNATPNSPLMALAAQAGLRPAHPDDPATCNVNGGARTLDYVLLCDRLKAHPQAPPPLADDTPMPSNAEPSDHLPLTAEVRWA